MNLPVIGFVVPCFNEQEVLVTTIEQLLLILDSQKSLGRISSQSSLWLVDDGSSDSTWERISEVALKNNSVKGIKLSKNYGHQLALLAGLHNADGDALISIDADLQDDIRVIPKMIDSFIDEGVDIVYGVRSSRHADSMFKRVSAESYYKLLAFMGVSVVFNHADFRLMSRRALGLLKMFGEKNIFLRGLVPQLGLSSSIIEYERLERFAGESKYPLFKMLALAVNGLTSFSVRPLRLITFIGVCISFISILLVVWALIVRIYYGDVVPGWASIVIPMFFLFGIQIFSVGVIGEYIAKIFIEVKNRPLYLIDQILI